MAKSKLEMTPELFRLAEQALEEARIPGADRPEYDVHKWAHRLAEKLSVQQVDLLAPLPSESDRRESADGKAVAKFVEATRKRPQLRNTLLRNCAIKEVVPEELIKLSDGRLVERGMMYADDQRLLAQKCRAEARAADETAEAEEALSDPFNVWQARELLKGRPRSSLTQMAFWMECGHIARPLAAE